MSNYTDKEKMEIATTIIQQMGGGGKLRAMVGASDIFALEAGVQFSFKGCKEANKVKIDLTEMDTYNISFYKIPKLGKINTKNLESFMAKIETCNTPIKTFEGAYEDMLKPIFEETTGLYLSL